MSLLATTNPSPPTPEPPDELDGLFLSLQRLCDESADVRLAAATLSMIRLLRAIQSAERKRFPINLRYTL
jgi:hypothetical protein